MFYKTNKQNKQTKNPTKLKCQDMPKLIFLINYKLTHEKGTCILKPESSANKNEYVHQRNKAHSAGMKCSKTVLQPTKDY